MYIYTYVHINYIYIHKHWDILSFDGSVDCKKWLIMCRGNCETQVFGYLEGLGMLRYAL